MKINELKVITAWQFDVRTNKGNPPFVNITSALGGPRAVAQPPQSGGEQYAVTFYVAPQEWLIQVEGGQWLHMSDHTAFFLLDQTEEKGTDDAQPVQVSDKMTGGSKE